MKTLIATLAACLFATIAPASPRPNVVLILADDMGFSDVGCYGSEIQTPHIDSLARDGLRFAQFYNMARCCPTRAALLTGLYPHQAGIGAMNQNLGPESYRGQLNQHCATIAELLRDAGYHTGMVGKWHLSHLDISAGGPNSKRQLNFEDPTHISDDKSSWPYNRGFEQHVGTIAGVESYYDPYSLVRNEETIRPETNDFYYTDFINDNAVRMIDEFSADNKPFFLYVAETAPHWPMQARESDIAPYASTYKVGWDQIRKNRLDRLVAMGMVKPELSARANYPRLNAGPSALSPWDDAPAKDWQARRMAVYAGMVSCLDRNVGKILAKLHDKGLDQNTLVIFLSDNGGCAENVQPGWYDIPSKTRDGRPIHVGDDPAFSPGPETVYQSYGPAWANNSNTPFRRFKHWTEEGGISAPFIVRFPPLIQNPGSIDHTSVGHVIDLLPTLLDLAGVTYPKQFHDRPLLPPEGTTLLPIFHGQPLPPRPLFWEHEGNRAARLGDFKIVAAHNEPWQLYNLAEDRIESHNLATQMPEKLQELRQLYDAWAARCGVLPWPVKNP